jgi:hypothetical protein
VAKNVANVGLVDTRGFETDGVHYKLNGMIALGKGYAVNWLTKFRVPVGLAPNLRATAPNRAYQVRMLEGVRYLCGTADCFTANGRGPNPPFALDIPTNHSSRPSIRVLHAACP